MPRPTLRMKSLPIRLSAVTAGAIVLLLGAPGCRCPRPGPLPPNPVVTCHGITLFAQPDDRVVLEGTPAEFAVGATPDTVTFQWYRGTYLIPGATNAVFTIGKAAKTDVGFYQCRIQQKSAVWSRAASLMVFTLSAAAGVPQTVTGPYMPGSASRGTCPGPYKGSFTLVAPTGSRWFVAPTFAPPPLTATDRSPYNSRVEIVQYSPLATACGPKTASIARPVPGGRYQFTVYFTGGVLPAPGEPNSVDLAW